MDRQTLALAAMTASIGLPAGCSLKYDVDMHTDGKTIAREVSVSSEVPPPQIKALEDTYGSPAKPDEDAQKPMLTFHGTSSGTAWPDGFGGQGAWTIVDSPLGSTTFFCESVGGFVPTFDDLTQLAAGLEAIEEAIRKQLLEKLGDDPEIRKVLRVIRKRALPDVQDAAMMGWAMMFTMNALPDLEAVASDHVKKQMNDQLKSRFSQAAASFLWQRGWITAEEALIGAQDLVKLEPFTGLIILRALDMKPSEGWARRLEDMYSRIGDAFDDQFSKTVEKAFAKAVGDRPHLIMAYITVTSILTSHKVSIRLHADTAPTVTNGKWVTDGDPYVGWTTDTAPMAIGLTMPPVLWSAAWAEPDETYQAQLLGKARIDDKELVAFCAAWNSSSSVQQASVSKALKSILSSRASTNADLDASDVLKECIGIMLEDKAPKHVKGR